MTSEFCSYDIIQGPFSPGFSDGAFHGKEDGGGEEEWRFPHRLGGEDGPRVGGAAEETHVELGGDVAEAGDLVGAGPLRQEVAVGRVHELLHHEQPVTLQNDANEANGIDISYVVKLRVLGG